MNGFWRKSGEWVLRVLGIFVILEPIWMLLPFAGFLYGSVLHIEYLSRHASTAWLTHFVFPVLVIGIAGPALVVLGLLLFVVGAVQIYGAKIRKSGLVTGGLYRFVRHPQYISLTLLGGGVLLTWGRAITFIAFFLMMFLYYWLARREERICIDLFGDDYRRYRERTSFIFPGDRRLRGRIRLEAWPAFARVVLGLLVTTAACFGLMAVVNLVKIANREVPFLTAGVVAADSAVLPAGVEAGSSAGIPFATDGRLAVVRGPWRSAAVPGFAERAIVRIRESGTLAPHLSYLNEPDGDFAIAFCAPFGIPESPGGAGPGRPPVGDESGRRGPPTDPDGPDRASLVILRCRPTAGASVADLFADKSQRSIRGAVIAPVNLALPPSEDVVEGKLRIPGPGFPGENRWDHFIAQMAEAETTAAPTAPSGPIPSENLVLVKAPILRTRLDPAFAEEILDRLKGSAEFQGRITSALAGGGLVAVAFPRPGPNWYREHRGVPQVSVFVILAAPTSPEASLKALFSPGGRTLHGAFIAELDFGVAPPGDPVTAIRPIGRRRDLEERWNFFLSGL